MATLDQIAGNAGNLSIPLYVKKLPSPGGRGVGGEGNQTSLRAAWENWQSDGRGFWRQMDALVETLDGLATDLPRK